MSASATNQPQSSIELVAEKLGKDWAALSAALYNTWDAGQNDRETLDRDLTIWNNFYEMRLAPRNWPWPKASNIATTIIPTQLDTMLANIVLQVYAIQRFYVVNGNTGDAAQNQHDVEQYLNAELFRARLGQSWLMQHVEALFAGLRDGCGITAITWRREIKNERVAIVQRLRDPETGIDILDPLTGKPIIHTHTEEQNIPVYDDVDLQTVELRDFGVIPAWQTDIDKAAAVWRRVYLDSTELHAMCKNTENPDGPLDRKAVDYALSMCTPGKSQLNLARQGTSTYQMADQIQIGDEEGGAAAPQLRQHIGPIEVVVMHSRQFFDGKEYIFWFSPQSQTCLGYQRFQYWHGQRPYSVKRPLPRVRRFYGISLIERLLPTVVEIQANRNRRNDFLDQRTLPPSYEIDGAKLITKGNAWEPGARWKLPNKEAVGIIQMPNDIHYLLAGREEEQVMREDINEFTGNSAPMLGMPTSGRPTAKGIQAAIARASVRHNFVAMHVRDADARTLYQIVQLKIQYGPDVNVTDTQMGGVPKRLQIPKDILAQDYTFSIAGSGGPLDKSTRTNEMQSLYALLMNNPLVAGNQVRMWGVTRMLLEEYNRADILALIGTRDEAEQQAKLNQMLAPLMGAMGGGQQPGGKPAGAPQPQMPGGG